MRRVARWWRRSLAARVVTGTVVLSALAITLTGWALTRDVAASLAQNRRTVALAEARSGFELAQGRLESSTSAGSASQAAALADMIDSVSAQTSRRGYELVVAGPLSQQGSSGVPVRSTSGVSMDQVPADLRSSVVSEPGMYWQYASAQLGSAPERSEPVVVVGQQLRAPGTGDTYAMYYLYSLREQQQTLSLMRNALLLGGLAMVLMVGAVAWLVSRQVLAPVRSARQTAERFSAGDLDRRMPVKGEDDIARLQMSLNQMATNLTEQISRLENLSQLQQRFVSDVSHELRTPLTTIRMASEMLFDTREDFDAPSARAAELLHSELDRFADLLSDLLDLSRFDAGAAQLELTDVDLAAVATTTQNNLLLQQAGIAVEVVGAERPVVVQADPRRVDRILRNVLANAAKYAGSDRLVLTVADSGDAVSLSVRDYGAGLSEAEAARVFDRFWRADPARAERGTGLGMPISREDALLHGGDLALFSRRGDGTDIVLTLPRRPGTSVQPALISELAP